MRRWAAMLMAAAVVVAGCGGPKEKGATVDPGRMARECAPRIAGADVYAGRAMVSFRAECPVNISGYNIYVSERPLVEEHGGTRLPDGVEPWNHPVYPGDTNPEDGVETYEAERLEDGVRYYVHVRTVFPDRTLSRPSEEITIVPGPRGTMELAARYSSEQDGFSFAGNKYVRADALENDLYFYSAEGRDYLASPDRLGFLRGTKFRVLPFRGEIGEVAAEVERMSSLPTEARVAIEEGEWVQVMTEDRTFALVRVMVIFGGEGERRVRLYYAWSPLAGAPVF